MVISVGVAPLAPGKGLETEARVGKIWGVIDSLQIMEDSNHGVRTLIIEVIVDTTKVKIKGTDQMTVVFALREQNLA